jgi:hypothetical protein
MPAIQDLGTVTFTYLTQRRDRLGKRWRNERQLPAERMIPSAHPWPPVSPNPGQERPLICLGNARHKTCPEQWITLLSGIMEAEFGQSVAISIPFAGGYITRHYDQRKLWIQLELSRTNKVTNQDKTAGLLNSRRQYSDENPSFLLQQQPNIVT